MLCHFCQFQLVRVPLAEVLVHQLSHHLTGGGVGLDNDVVEGLVALTQFGVHADHPTGTAPEVELGVV